MRDADVAVVGAGLAGLAAARRARGRGALRRRARGARPRRRPDAQRAGRPGPDQVVELGAQWVGPTQHRLLALARELGVATYPTHGEGEYLFASGEKVERYRGTIPPMNPLALADLGQAMARLNLMARARPARGAVDAPGARARWDAQTFATWMRRNVRTRVGAGDAPARARGRLGGRRRASRRCCTSSSTSTRPGRSRRCSTPRAARSRTASWAARSCSRSGWRRRCDVVPRAPVRAIAQDADGVTVRADGAARCAPARDRRRARARSARPIAWTPAAAATTASGWSSGWRWAAS